MTNYGMDPTETQPERTTLAWQRTFVSALTVAGAGSLRYIATGQAVFTVIAIVIAGIAAIPIVSRQSQLRRGDFSVVSWQPVMLIVCIVAFAIASLLAV